MRAGPRPWRLALIALAAAGAWAGPAAAQVTFRSVEVYGVGAAARAAGGETRSVAHPDDGIRFWSDDGRNFVLDGFGCRFALAPLRAPLSEADAAVADAVSQDVAAYRGSAARTLAGGGELVAVSVGELARIGPGPAGQEAYGLTCADDVVTAVSLDVLRGRGTPRLRILVLQTAEGAAARSADVLAVAVMENLIFSPRTQAELSRAGPLTARLYGALTR